MELFYFRKIRALSASPLEAYRDCVNGTWSLIMTGCQKYTCDALESINAETDSCL